MVRHHQRFILVPCAILQHSCYCMYCTLRLSRWGHCTIAVLSTTTDGSHTLLTTSDHLLLFGLGSSVVFTPQNNFHQPI
jgi:hypothetical protein